MHIAIVGCGQLARMLALAGWPMGLSFSFLAEQGDDTACVNGLGKVVYRQEYRYVASLFHALGRPQVITVEKEDVDTGLLRELQNFCPVYPDPEIIHTCQHRAREKRFLQYVGVDTARFEVIGGIADLPAALERLGFPVIIKSCEQGYDGQNQWRLNNEQDYAAFRHATTHLPESVVESRVDFEREISVLVVRSRNGQVRVYPPTENTHHNGILLTSIAPADDLSATMLNRIDSLVHRIMAGWNYIGVLAIECFVTADRILVNEMAPRVHNSGHWTQQGAPTSQFENHLRAITGRVPGNTEPQTNTAMVNLLGRTVPVPLNGESNTYLHLYNKTLRPGRKVGHINMLDQDRSRLKQQLREMVTSIYGDLPGRASG